MHYADYSNLLQFILDFWPANLMCEKLLTLPTLLLANKHPRGKMTFKLSDGKMLSVRPSHFQRQSCCCSGSFARDMGLIDLEARAYTLKWAICWSEIL